MGVYMKEVQGGKEMKHNYSEFKRKARAHQIEFRKNKLFAKIKQITIIVVHIITNFNLLLLLVINIKKKI